MLIVSLVFPNKMRALKNFKDIIFHIVVKMSLFTFIAKDHFYVQIVATLESFVSDKKYYEVSIMLQVNHFYCY